MRIGDRYAVVFECVPDQEQHIGGVFVRAIVDTVHPELHREIDAAFTKATQFAIRGIGRVEDLGMLGHRRLDDPRHQIDVGIVADGKRGFVAVGRAGIRVVHDAGGDEILVRDNDPTTIIRLKDGGAGRHLDDDPGLAAIQFDIVAHGRLPLDQKDHARNEIRGNLLQTKTEANTDGTTDHGKGRKVDAHDIHQQQEGRGKDQKLDRLGDQLTERGAHFLLLGDEGGGLVVGPAAQPKEEPACDQAAHKRHGRKLDVAKDNLHRGQPLCRHVQQAQRIKRGNGHHDIAAQQLQERVGDDVADQSTHREEQEHTFAKGNNCAAVEKGADNAFADTRKDIGQERQQQRQELRHKPTGLGDDAVVFAGIEQTGQNRVEAAGDQNGQNVGNDQQPELGPSRRA
mmetsp:Transcript_7080/g.11507  ORF Transcript_7080/g.11507 Transcript_7080/m.11507 type:complete len:399 (-) Transcript_7080:504-1700(-)